MRPLFRNLLRLAVTAAVLVASLWLCGLLFRPAQLPPPVRSAEEIAAITARRALQLHPEHPPVIFQAVDYREGARGAWWPRVDPPVIAPHVAAGRLPSTAERTGPEPIVLAGLDHAANYGGTWQRVVASDADVGQIYYRLSYMNLVRWSPEGYPIVPHLAKSWEASPDSRVYTFHLRAGLRWSDGHPMTARDIGFWYENEVLYFEGNPRFLRNGASLGRVEVVDDLTVRFVFDEPNPLFLERAASNANGPTEITDCFAPAHYLRQFHPKLGDPALLARMMRALKLASPTAVYQRLKQWDNPEIPRNWPWIYRTRTPTAPYVFVRNPYFPAVDPAGRQLPYLDRLVLTARPSNLVAFTAATGQVSMQDRLIRYEDHVLLLSEAERHGYDVYHWYPANRSAFTIFPVINRRVDPGDPATKWKAQLLNDRRFRQALSLAIDRPAIINALFNGQGEPAQIDPGRDSPYHSPELFKSYTTHDPARANALLDSLGLTHRDREGYRTYPDGTRMVWYLNMTEYTGNDPAQFVVDDWAAVGVRCIARIRSRLLFYSEKAAYLHDFTVWAGESEFNPLIESRNFVPTYIESFYAPGYGLWYQNGGLYGSARSSSNRGSLEPPAGHPLRRSMALLDRITHTESEAERVALFRQIEAVNAEEVWHISFSTPPPQLVVVKQGLRNVPPIAVFGNIYNTPGNAGIETYAWDDPQDLPATIDDVRRAMVEITPDPAVAAGRGDGPSGQVGLAAGRGDTRVANLIYGLFGAAATLLVVLLALRHPFIGRRLLLMIPTLAIVSVLVFTIVQLPPGDFATTRIMDLEMAGSAASAQGIADLRKNFHLDDSMASRYFRWTGLTWFTTFKAADTGLLQGNLGLSMEQNKPVSSVVGDRIMLTVLVSLATILFTWLLALPIGIYSAVRQYSPGDYALTLLGFLGMSVPGFLLAVVAMWIANRWLGLQVGGLFSPEFGTMPGWNLAKVADLLQHLWLPVLVLGFGGTAAMIRVMRANLLDELRKPYVTTARAKGLRPARLLFKYPVRIALNPFISVLGTLFPQLVSGGAIVALVLSLPMVGPVMIDALLAEDVYLAGSLLMVLSLLGVVGTLVSDLLLLWLDPRIRLEGKSS